MNIYDLKAGTELDVLVARMVMGCRADSSGYCQCPDRPHADWQQDMQARIPVLKAYSRDMRFAWEVLETIWEETKNAKIRRLFKWERFADGSVADKGPWGCTYGELSTYAFAETGPLAICRASIGWAEEKRKAKS